MKKVEIKIVTDQNRVGDSDTDEKSASFEMKL